MTTFAGLPSRTLSDLAGVRLAIVGASDASPYEAGIPSHSAGAPAAIRKASQLFAKQLEQVDFDTGATLVASPADRDAIADCGDVPTDPADPEGNRDRIAAAVRTILEAGAVPIVLGGDDSVPIPGFRGFEGRGPFTVVQVDAHVDWGDVIRGNPFGYGSTMRRAAELPWITGMVQVGIRGYGSGPAPQHADARAWGSRIVTMRDVRRDGLGAVADAIPRGAECLVAIDCDGLDPTVIPAVGMPTPGGLAYADLLDLLTALAERGRIAGAFLVELVPTKDPSGLSALTAARIALTLMGLAQRA